MTTSPIIWSVIIPTMNRADSLQRTLGALCKQNMHPLLYEILVVDNGSTDHTQRVVQHCMEAFPQRQVRFLQASPPGLLTGRHKGAAESRGSILTFVDDDIDVAENYGASIVAAFQNTDAQLVGGPCRPRYEAEPPHWLERYCQRSPHSFVCGALSLYDFGETEQTMPPGQVWGLNFSIRREALWEYGGFHPDNVPQQYQMFQGDGESGLIAGMARRGCTARYVPGAAVTHVIPASRLTEAYFRNRFFYQGVCDSYTEIRAKQNTHDLHIPLPVHVDAASEEALHQRIHNAYVDGYLFHQNAVKQSPRLLAWVLKENYEEYDYPELEMAEFRRDWSVEVLSMLNEENSRTVAAATAGDHLEEQPYRLPLTNIDADPSFFYGEIGQKDFMDILRASEATGDVEKAIHDWCDKTGNAYFRTYALDPRRALGLRLLGDMRGAKVLDYGCGIGSLGVPAGMAGAHVTFVDNCLPRLRMALMRTTQAKIKNCQGLACATWNSLPKSCTGFDYILVNGVLEWVPSTVGASFDTVVDVQLEFLATLRDRLNDDGKIYLAIENRFALQYTSGYPEDHTNIPYLSLMGREKANALHRKEKNADYTVWTWGLNEFHERLPRVGLSVKQGYALFPDYRFPQLAVALDDEEGLLQGMALEQYGDSEQRRLLTEYFYEMRQLRNVVYSYALILQKD